MGRRRVPASPTARYITPDGADRLRAELDRLWRVERPQVTQAVADAAAMGDRSENAEYLYGKKRLGEMDRRIHYLQKRLGELIVVDRVPDDPTRVFFGAWVRLEDATGDFSTYRIVGTDEFDPERGFISIDSPLARALLKKAMDDEVAVPLPKGSAIYTVVEVRYRPFDDELPSPSRPQPRGI